MARRPLFGAQRVGRIPVSCCRGLLPASDLPAFLLPVQAETGKELAEPVPGHSSRIAHRKPHCGIRDREP